MRLSTWIVLALASVGAAAAARKALRLDGETLGRHLSERCDDLTRQLELRLDQKKAA